MRFSARDIHFWFFHFGTGLRHLRVCLRHVFTGLRQIRVVLRHIGSQSCHISNGFRHVRLSHRHISSLCRHESNLNGRLPGEAVQGAEPPDQFHGVIADGQKCERCWHWETGIGQNAGHPTICGRCVEAVKQFKA